MSKTNKTSRNLILACACVCAGVVLCVISALFILFDPGTGDFYNYHTVEHTPDAPFTAVVIEGNTEADILLRLADDGQCRVVAHEQERFPTTVTVEDGVLVIRELTKRRWYDYIQLLPMQPPKLTLYLPAADYASLSVTTDTGEVEVADTLSFGDVTVHTSTGDTRLRCAVTGMLHVTATTGAIDIRSCTPRAVTLALDTGNVVLCDVTATEDISVTTSTGRQELSDISCRALRLRSSTGNIECQRIEAAGALQCRASTGRISLSRTKCDALQGRTSTGGIVCQQLEVQGQLTMETTTGDVQLTDCDAAQLHITTDTGDVSGTLRTDKVFYATSDTGRIRVPHSTEGGLCEVRTDTGNITFDIAA